MTETEVLITINGQTASKRTRVRVRTDGPRFILFRESDDGKRVLLKSSLRGWNGWLPKREIKIHRLTTTHDDNQPTTN